jgi:hypothetical protein
MIYQFCKYLETEFPTETIYRNVRGIIFPATEVPARNILIKETGGTRQAWSGYTEATLQIITRDVDMPKARQLGQEVYEEIIERYGQVLPAETVDGVTFPAIHSAQISAINEPQSIGADKNGRYEFSANYKIIYVREVTH